jgi:HSP20 family protein
MSAPDSFARNMGELDEKEIQYTEDFFRREFGGLDTPFHPNAERDTEDLIRETSAHLPKMNLAPRFSGKDVDETWLKEDPVSYDGELAVDVFQTDQEVVITSTVAGVRKEDLDIDMNGDMITIKGIRRPQFSHIPDDDFFVQECYWGGFSRTIILPVDIQYDKVRATLENGILTVFLPKATYSKNSKITVEEL